MKETGKKYRENCPSSAIPTPPIPRTYEILHFLDGSAFKNRPISIEKSSYLAYLHNLRVPWSVRKKLHFGVGKNDYPLYPDGFQTVIRKEFFNLRYLPPYLPGWIFHFHLINLSPPPSFFLLPTAIMLPCAISLLIFRDGSFISTL